MPRRSGTPKQHSAYLIVSSDEPAMAVGSIVLDKGAMLVRDWTLMDFTTEQETGAVGQRLARVCADCRVKHNIVGILGHDGECGSADVKAEGLAELRDAKKRLMAEVGV